MDVRAFCYNTKTKQTSYLVSCRHGRLDSLKLFSFSVSCFVTAKSGRGYRREPRRRHQSYYVLDYMLLVETKLFHP